MSKNTDSQPSIINVVISCYGDYPRNQALATSLAGYMPAESCLLLGVTDGIIDAEFQLVDEATAYHVEKIVKHWAEENEVVEEFEMNFRKISQSTFKQNQKFIQAVR